MWTRRDSIKLPPPRLPPDPRPAMFPVYRRIVTMIFVPLDTYSSSIEMVTIDPRHLQEALDRDRAIP
jgi:hypothetical protein